MLWPYTMNEVRKVTVKCVAMSITKNNNKKMKRSETNTCGRHHLNTSW